MSRFLFFLFISSVIQSLNLVANPGEKANQFHFAKIKRIETAYFGAHRLFFDLACNETFLSVLTEKEKSGFLPEVSPYHPVKLFGTSEKQTREKIPCYPSEQINMNCEIIEVL